MKTKILLSIILFSASIGLGFAQATQATNAIAAGSYLGTSNSTDVIFKRNAVTIGVLGSNQVSFGQNSSTVLTESVTIGANAGRYATNSTHPRNVYIGLNSGAGNTTTANSGINNTFLGFSSGASNTDGNNNVFVGSSSGSGNASGDENVCVGQSAGNANGGSQNVLLGAYSGSSLTSASGNVFLGNYSGANETGSNLLYIDNSNTATPLLWGTFSATTPLLKLNGKTGIGMGTNSFPTSVGGASVTTYNLFVRGGILADEVRVRTTWSDYVFEDSYKLPTLEEVEKHIKEKGYLMNVPSGKTVESDGIEVGQMAKIQQEKIEELTLYVIEQNKINKQQAEEIAELKAMVKAMADKK